MYYCDKIEKLDYHKYAKCGYEIYGPENENVLFYSYDTIVLDCCYEYLMCTGLYSATTRKHISWILREFFPNISYQRIKKIAGKFPLVIDVYSGDIINYETGEVIECG